MNPGSSYTPGREIARGGMGAILSATDQTLDREVAMKVMLEAGERDPVARQRFMREALVLARLEHPNIVPIHEMGRDEQGRRFYTMKLVKGRTLQAIILAIKKGDALTTQHYTLDRLLTIYRKVCDAIAFAHHQRIIHRDLKPENVMVGEFGEVLVMDWGLAKHLDDEAHSQTEAESAAKAPPIDGFQELSGGELAGGAGNLTLEGAVMGSPQYMAPEQAEGRISDLGAHSDIYSLGAILYAILTLRHPVTGKNLMDVLEKVARGDIAPPTIYNRMTAEPAKADAGEVASAKKFAGLPHCPDGQVPESLSAVTMRAMARKPEKRYRSVGQLIGDIEAYQDGFATSAENAGLFTQVRLLVRRHKAISALGAVMLLLTAGFVAKLFSSERKATAFATEARQRLTELRGTAPIFRAQAQVDFEAGKRDDALQKLGYAIQLDDSVADYHLFRAHLWQSSFQLSEAADGYRRVLELEPEEPSAKENLALCVKLLRESGGAELNRDQKLQLLAALRVQKRALEAAPLAALLDPDIAAMRAAILSRVRAVRKQAGWNDLNNVHTFPDGTFRIIFGQLMLDDFSVLKGLPVSALVFRGSPISDLRSLAGLPLKELRLANSTRVTDLSPLRGMRLESLTVTGYGGNGSRSPLTDLTPLRGMKLKSLSLDHSDVSDIRVLAGMPLEGLSLDHTRVRDLTPLAQCKHLGMLNVLEAPVSDLGPLAGLPLTELICSGKKITSVGALAGASLKKLSLTGTSVTDLSHLAQCTQLEELHLDGTPVSDLGPVAKLPLKRLVLLNTKVTSLSPLAECATLEAITLPAKVDLSVLRRLPRLKDISWSPGGGRAEDFWREYDAKQKPTPK